MAASCIESSASSPPGRKAPPSRQAPLRGERPISEDKMDKLTFEEQDQLRKERCCNPETLL